MNPLYPRVAKRARGRCEYCGAPERLQSSLLEVEHVFPQSRGGSNEPDNLALACRACNLRKQDRTEFLDEVTGSAAAIFDPRKNKWSEHFEFDPDTCFVHGLTPTGRATVALLDLNNAQQVRARSIWVQLRTYP